MVAGIGIELVLQAIGSNSATELGIVRVSKRRGVIVRRRAQDGGTDIHDLSKRVVGLETQSISATPGQRDIGRMVTCGSHIHPCVGRAEKWIRTRPHRNVLGSLRNCDLEAGRADSAAAASRRVIADHRLNRVVIHGGREMIGLVADIADLHCHV